MTQRYYQYHTYQDDVVTSKQQNYHLPANYQWIHHNRFYQLMSTLLYRLAYVVCGGYCKYGLHVKIKNQAVLLPYRNQGYFIYGNHTQPVGDVFAPMHVVPHQHLYYIASPANLGVPVIGKLLPCGGALPIPESLRQMRPFIAAIKTRIQQHQPILIYPEAHVWPYYTQIRPFMEAAFHYPVALDVPSFCITTTYQKRRYDSKPQITLYVDGPFWPDKTLSRKQQQQQLCQQIHEQMQQRAQAYSNYEFVHYQKI
ncbi:MAG: acyl-phosphate glycerol 3-phosphate acyltransferase [Candidatus Paralactobacillus gallistercoris]|uniref:Acyl-phosphate glycerol 3-phosphate acyltransferase n=1 Tax=Candidatus Paralactobacillus gallistercoris TaxID=2838724 RepID=A0A948TK09_9LACO|nr:acyl-phosphate glycerol 3-phosphate acyltransferase [Candidatus Paralactobacillus gallistercoris]